MKIVHLSRHRGVWVAAFLHSDGTCSRGYADTPELAYRRMCDLAAPRIRHLRGDHSQECAG